MSVEENIRTVRSFFEDYWDDGKLDNPSEYFAQDLVAHDPYLPQGKRGFQEYVDYCNEVTSAISSLKGSIENIVASDDKVVIHWIVRGKHTGFAQGLPATNKPLTLEAMTICRVANGKIAEVWDVADKFEMLQELGLIPQVGMLGGKRAEEAAAR